jgi:hypothetical protein
MKATEVYSWRVDQRLKEELESAARTEQTSLAALLSRIAHDWLRRGYPVADDATAQRRVREAAAPYLGSVSGGTPSRAAEAATRVRATIRSKHASRRPH